MSKVSDSYAIVEQVRIKDVTTDAIEFETRSEGKTPEECTLRTFRVPRNEVYEQQPPQGPEPVKLTSGQEGVMYLSEQGWTVTSEGQRIYGADEAVFKWPQYGSLPELAFDELELVPTSIVVRGTCTRNGEKTPVEIDLLSEECGNAQSIAWTGASEIDVAMGAEKLSIWPTAIEITGAPKHHPDLMGSVNVLDSELAARTQRFSWSDRGEPVKLTLTQDGFSCFHVVPEPAETSAA